MIQLNLLYFGNLPTSNHGPTLTYCNHYQIGKGLQIIVVLFINSDGLPTCCNQSESVCADEKNSSAICFCAIVDDSTGCQLDVFWLNSCKTQCCQVLTSVYSQIVVQQLNHYLQWNFCFNSRKFRLDCKFIGFGCNHFGHGMFSYWKL